MAIAMGSIQVTRARHTVVYEIVVQKNTVEIVASGRATGEVDWQVVKTVGSVKTPISVTTGTNEFSLNGGVTWKTASNDSKNTFNSGTAIVDSSTAPSSIIMRCTVEGTVVCSKELSFVKALSEITSANVYYILADSDSKEPTDSDIDANAKDKFNDLTLLPNKYVWQATKVMYSNGTYDWTGKFCLGKTENYKSGTEIYALSDSGTSAPGLPGTANAATWKSDTNFKDANDNLIDKKGKYLWTSTQLIWADGSKTYTTPVCIGYYGNNGTSGGGSRIRYALSEYATSTDNRTAPADLRMPFYWNGDGYLEVYNGNNVPSEYKTYNGVTYDDGWLMWKLAMPTPTKDKPYIWAMSYVLVDGKNENRVNNTTNDTFTYSVINGSSEEVTGSDTYYQLSTDGVNHPTPAPGQTGSGWQTTVPTQTDELPFLWTCVVTHYKNGEDQYAYSVTRKGQPADYYEIRFKRQNFNVLVKEDQVDYIKGFVRADFECSVYHIVGDKSTEENDGGAQVKFTFRYKNSSGNMVAMDILDITNPKTVSVDSSTKTIIFVHDFLKDSTGNTGYYAASEQMVDCLCEIVSSKTVDKRETVIPINFAPAAVFEHSNQVFESIFQSGSKFSQLEQDVDGIRTHVRMMVQNLLMGTTTAIGWTEEKSQSYVDKFAFTSGSRQFVMHNYWPIGIENFGSDQGTSNPSAVETLKSPIIKIQRGKYYILSFKGSCDTNVVWNVGVRFGTNSLCNQEAKYFEVYNKLDHSDTPYCPDRYSSKDTGVVCRYDDDTSRFFVFFQASSNYDYMQVLFINGIRKDSTTTSTKTVTSDKTKVNATWPYSSLSSKYEYKDSVTTYDAKKNTKTIRHYYAQYYAYGSTDSYATWYEDTIEYMDTPCDLTITEPQLELSSVTDINDVVPSPYTETQNVVESYIKQTVDSIKLYANNIIIDANHKLSINGDFVNIKTKNFTLDDSGNVSITGIINATGGTFSGKSGYFNFLIDADNHEISMFGPRSFLDSSLTTSVSTTEKFEYISLGKTSGQLISGLSQYAPVVQLKMSFPYADSSYSYDMSLDAVHGLVFSTPDASPTSWVSLNAAGLKLYHGVSIWVDYDQYPKKVKGSYIEKGTVYLDGDTLKVKTNDSYF